MPDLVRRFDASARSGGTPRPDDLAHVVWLTKAVLFRLYRTDFCMKQSLVLFGLLSERGLPVQIVFGVKKEAGELKGHAWVELDGAPVGENVDPRTAYAPAYTYTAGAASDDPSAISPPIVTADR